MKNSMIWFDRKFSFDFGTDLFPMVVERLRGTPLRLDHKLAKLSSDILIRHPEKGWSIQQQAGHLIVIEALWIGRLDDFLSGEESLRPADLTNSKTEETDFHSQPIQSILSEFSTLRLGLVDRLYELTPDQAGLTALHPRLNQPMRLIDAFCFAAEHDDHHLARMTDLAFRSQT